MQFESKYKVYAMFFLLGMPMYHIKRKKEMPFFHYNVDSIVQYQGSGLECIIMLRKESASMPLFVVLCLLENALDYH